MSQNKEPLYDYKVSRLTETIHKRAYPAILPTKPSLSQTGRTVLVTGGATGIGLEAAKSFAIAGATRVIIVGRESVKVLNVAETLRQEFQGGPTIFEGRECQISNPQSIDALWDSLARDGVHVDVLILNAAMTGVGKMWELGWEWIWRQFEVNVRAHHQFCQRLDQQKTGNGRQKVVINVATSAIHDWPATKNSPSYGLTKNSGTLLLQQLASEKNPADMQIISFHPGAILSPSAQLYGLDENSLDWDDVSLPGSLAVWCASPEATFLHGRFIWSAWDVEELQTGQLRERIDSDEQFLRIGVHGL